MTCAQNCCAVPRRQIFEPGIIQRIDSLAAVEQRVLQPPLRSDDQLRVHSHDSVLAELLDYLAIYAGDAEDEPDRWRVVLEAVRGDQREIKRPAAIEHIADDPLRVLELCV